MKRTESDYTEEERACPCHSQGCPEHPYHQGSDHTYEQHHSPEDHVDLDGNERPDLCHCTVYQES